MVVTAWLLFWVAWMDSIPFTSDFLQLESRFASLLLNAMIGSAIEPVDGSYDAAISACQKGQGREQRFCAGHIGCRKLRQDRVPFLLRVVTVLGLLLQPGAPSGIWLWMPGTGRVEAWLRGCV